MFQVTFTNPAFPQDIRSITALRLRVAPGRLALEQIPAFRMPNNTMWPTYWGPPEVHNQLINRLGHTHLNADVIAYGNSWFGTNATQALTYWNSLRPGTKLYKMIMDNDMKFGMDRYKLYMVPPGITDPYVVDNQLGSMHHTRAGWLGLENVEMLLDLDLEAYPSHYTNLSVMIEGSGRFRARQPHVELCFFDAGPDNAYAHDGGSTDPNRRIGGIERYNIFKDVYRYHGITPYFYLTDASLWPGGKAECAAKSSFPIHTFLGWIDRRGPVFIGENYRGFSWVMTHFEAEAQTYAVPGHVMEALPLWYVVTGCARHNGGLVDWKDGREWLPGDSYIVAGMWRVGQFLEIFNNPNCQYNLRLEFSLDGGNTWETDVRQNRFGETTWDYNEYVRNISAEKRPYLRGALAGGKIMMVASCPSLKEGETQDVLVRYNGKVFPIKLRYQQTMAATLEVTPAS